MFSLFHGLDWVATGPATFVLPISLWPSDAPVIGPARAAGSAGCGAKRQFRYRNSEDDNYLSYTRNCDDEARVPWLNADTPGS